MKTTTNHHKTKYFHLSTFEKLVKIKSNFAFKCSLSAKKNNFKIFTRISMQRSNCVECQFRNLISICKLITEKIAYKMDQTWKWMLWVCIVSAPTASFYGTKIVWSSTQKYNLIQMQKKKKQPNQHNTNNVDDTRCLTMYWA